MTVYTGALDGRPAYGKMLQSSRCQGCGHLPTWVESEMPSRHVRCLTLASSEICGFYRTFPSRQSNKAQVLPVPMLSGDMTPPPCHPISCWPLSGLDSVPNSGLTPLGVALHPRVLLAATHCRPVRFVTVALLRAWLCSIGWKASISPAAHLAPTHAVLPPHPTPQRSFSPTMYTQLCTASYCLQTVFCVFTSPSQVGGARLKSREPHSPWREDKRGCQSGWTLGVQGTWLGIPT